MKRPGHLGHVFPIYVSVFCVSHFYSLFLLTLCCWYFCFYLWDRLFLSAGSLQPGNLLRQWSQKAIFSNLFRLHLLYGNTFTRTWLQAAWMLGKIEFLKIVLAVAYTIAIWRRKYESSQSNFSTLHYAWLSLARNGRKNWKNINTLWVTHTCCIISLFKGNRCSCEYMYIFCHF